jgi:hypothetical protein
MVCFSQIVLSPQLCSNFNSDIIKLKEGANMWVVISGILGILGFIISLINIVNYFLSRRINLEIKITEFAFRNGCKDTKRLFVHYQMNNKSKLPIAITDMQLLIQGHLYIEDYNTHEVMAYHHTAKEINEYVPTYNEHLPINLPMLSSRAGYLVFAIPEDIAECVHKDLTFQIRTNRCKEVQKTFALNELVTLRHIPLKK